MFKKTLLAFAFLATFSAASAQDSYPYKVIVPLGAEMNGNQAVLINYDNGQAVDSVLVTNGSALFQGSIDEPIAARILVGSGRSPQFVLESGSIAYDNERHFFFGSPLNDIYREINDSISIFSEKFQAATSDADKQNAYNGYVSYLEKKMRENVDNPVGYLLFLDMAYEMGPKELVDFIDSNSSMGKYDRVQKLIEANRRKAATSTGAKYIDFDIEGKKLSDYVGIDGKYLLVDFFASWCGPCMRQMPVLKELYTTYADKLNILGVAVWDEPEASLKAIERENIPWLCIINAGTVPTDIYGISGIPCIMLISPDGTILSRDLQGDDLKAAVAAELAK